MPPAETVPANPEILRWAREDLGLSLFEASSRANIRPYHDLSPEERLEAIENGEVPIYKGMFKSLAQAYCLPEITFFLSSPPRKEKFFTDFRPLENQLHPHDSPEFAALIRKIMSIHRELERICKAESMEDLSFVRSLSMESPIDEFVHSMKALLDPDPRGHGAKRPEDYFSYLRNKAQESGIFVILTGDLGNSATEVSVKEFRGLCISDKKSPIIAINPYDSIRNQIFTLVHETSHILLGLTGYSNNRAPVDSSLVSRQENLSNAAAAEFLVPKKELLTRNMCCNLFDFVQQISDDYFVSQIVIAKRLLDISKITKDVYGCITSFFMGKVNDNTKKSTDGSNAEILLSSQLGEKLLNTLAAGADNGYIDYTDASNALGISLAKFFRLTKDVHY